jgi:hypothetical protein
MGSYRFLAGQEFFAADEVQVADEEGERHE